jgi:hypothetical protein
LERKKTTFTSPSGRATPPRQPPLPLCGRSCRNQLLPPRVSPPVAAPKNRVVRKRALVRASARLRALAGPQALQNHTALPGASAAHQGRCAARPLGRSRSQPPAESPARAREAWCSQQRGVNLQGAPGGTSASVPVRSQPLAEAARLASLSCSQPTPPAALRDAAPSSQSVLLPPAVDLNFCPKVNPIKRFAVASSCCCFVARAQYRKPDPPLAKANRFQTDSIAYKPLDRTKVVTCIATGPCTISLVAVSHHHSRAPSLPGGEPTQASSRQLPWQVSGSNLTGCRSRNCLGAAHSRIRRVQVCPLGKERRAKPTERVFSRNSLITIT